MTANINYILKLVNQIIIYVKTRKFKKKKKNHFQSVLFTLRILYICKMKPEIYKTGVLKSIGDVTIINTIINLSNNLYRLKK